MCNCSCQIRPGTKTTIDVSIEMDGIDRVELQVIINADDSRTIECFLVEGSQPPQYSGQVDGTIHQTYTLKVYREGQPVLAFNCAKPGYTDPDGGVCILVTPTSTSGSTSNTGCGSENSKSCPVQIPRQSGAK